MAKVRVYELAKELNTDSKALVNKLIAGGMNIKNYMSTLDEAAVSKARDIFYGAISEVVEEKRIKPTVIRRRKKTVRVAPETPEPKPEEAVVEEKGIPEEEVIVPEVEVKEVPLQEVEEIEVEEIEKPPEAKPKEKIKKPKKKKLEQAAKIIARPDEGPLKEVVEKKQEQEIAKGIPVPPEPPIAEVPEEPETEERGKAPKTKKDRKRAQKEEEAPKGTVRHRKIEIFERADLYDGRRVKRKKKEAAGHRFC